MQLNDEQREKIADWMTKKNIRKCPVCGSDELEVFDYLYTLFPLATNEEEVLKEIVVQCHTCVFMMHFNADRMGLKLAK